MAGTEELDTLLVKIAADTSSLRGELGKATAAMAKSMQQMAKETERTNAALEKVGSRIKQTIIGALGGLSIAKLTAMTRETLRWADDIGTLAERLNISTDALQELIFAGRELNVTSQQMAAGLQSFWAKVSEAATGKGEALPVLTALGIDPKSLQNAEQALVAIGQKLKNFNLQSQLSVSKSLFGDEKAAQFLALLTGDLERFKQKAREAGVVVDAELVKRGTAANKEIEKLTDQINTELRKAFIDLGPALVGVLSQLAAVARAVRLIINEAQNLTPERMGERARNSPDWVKRWSRGVGLIPPANVGEIARGFNPDTRTDAQKMRDADRASMNALPPRPPAQGDRPLDLSGKGAAQATAFARLMEDLKVKTEQATAALDPHRAAIADLNGKLAKLAATDRQSAQAREEFNKAWNALGAKALKEFGAENEHLAKIAAAEAAGRRDLVAVLELEWALRQKLGEKFVKDNAAQIEALAKQRLATEQLRERQQAAMQALEGLFDSFSGHAGQALDSVLDKSKTVGEAMRDFFIAALRDISNEMFKLAAINPLKNLLFGQNNATLGDVGGLFGSLLGNGTGSFFSGGDIIGGAFAEGGNPPMNRWSLVGEEGPEWIRPRSPMTVIPNGAPTGGGTAVLYGRPDSTVRLGEVEAQLRRLGFRVNMIDASVETRAINATKDDARRY